MPTTTITTVHIHRHTGIPYAGSISGQSHQADTSSGRGTGANLMLCLFIVAIIYIWRNSDHAFFEMRRDPRHEHELRRYRRGSRGRWVPINSQNSRRRAGETSTRPEGQDSDHRGAVGAARRHTTNHEARSETMTTSVNQDTILTPPESSLGDDRQPGSSKRSVSGPAIPARSPRSPWAESVTSSVENAPHSLFSDLEDPRAAMSSQHRQNDSTEQETAMGSQNDEPVHGVAGWSK